MKTGLTLFFVILVLQAQAVRLFIPMDATQTNHLRAYGVVFNAIGSGTRAEWLLNYKGGSFVMDYTSALDISCTAAGVSFSRMTDKDYNALIKRIKFTNFNGDVIPLTKAPKIAVYTPSNKKPWDDAVTLALTYAGIPFDKVYVDEVMAGALSKYDWLHLHHEDFTGQYGKFWATYKDVPWYREDCRVAERLAARHGFRKVSQMQLAMVKKIRDFVAGGGNLFAMCSATDTYDIALAAAGTDICDTPFDGDGIDPAAQAKLNFGNCFAFTGFTVSANKYEYEYATIDNTPMRFLPESTDKFTLLPFPAKFDHVPAMLTQNHTRSINGFMGQTTAFRKEALKPGVVVLADRKDIHEARYIHGSYKAGSWTFFGGHDPEDYQHMVGESPTDLAKHPNSPGYRLILNNVLCLASGKKDIPAVTFGQEAVPAAKADIPQQRSASGDIRIAAGNNANSLVISFAGPSEKAGVVRKIKSVAFLNAAGREVYARVYDAATVTVDMENLPAGMYNIKVNGEYAGKVVKN